MTNTVRLEDGTALSGYAVRDVVHLGPRLPSVFLRALSHFSCPGPFFAPLKIGCATTISKYEARHPCDLAVATGCAVPSRTAQDCHLIALAKQDSLGLDNLDGVLGLGPDVAAIRPTASEQAWEAQEREPQVMRIDGSSTLAGPYRPLLSALTDKVLLARQLCRRPPALTLLDLDRSTCAAHMPTRTCTRPHGEGTGTRSRCRGVAPAVADYAALHDSGLYGCLSATASVAPPVG